MKDLEKRRRVMQRSIRLGRCICDHKKPCPCDTFRDFDVGLSPVSGSNRPTGRPRLVENAGCASKIDLAGLKHVLGGLQFPSDPPVVVVAGAGDDPGVYQLDERTALVQMVDVFTPSVDDPYTFGQVAAANSVSDVYAIGNRPPTVFSIVGFPIGTVPDRVLLDIIRGGIDKAA